MKKHHRFGFASLSDLQNWFVAEDRRHLANNEYVVGVYKVDGRRVRKGRKQVAFIRDKAELIERRPLP